MHGVKHLEEIAEGWLCARRTLGILSMLARKWRVELPEEAVAVLERTDAKYGPYSTDRKSSKAQRHLSETIMNPSQFAADQSSLNHRVMPNTNTYMEPTSMPNANVSATHQGLSTQSSGDNYTLLPHDAHSLLAQQYPSASGTPGNNSQQSIDSKKAPSPVDMFGGVDQIIRDGQDWVFADSVMLSHGFENWNAMSSDPSLWPTNANNDGTSAIGGSPSNGGAATQTGMSMPTTQPSTYGMNTNNAMNNGYPMMNWLTDMNSYNDISTYNEDEWYS